MRTNLFKAFLIVILAALLSNFIFERQILKDFDNYSNRVKKDQLYWIEVSLKSSYQEGLWDVKAVGEALHWAMMLGWDTKVLNARGQEIMSSSAVMEHLPLPMKEHMNSLFQLEKLTVKYEAHPLAIQGRNIGSLLYRSFPKKEIEEKELIFKKRVKQFLLISFLIAGCGSLLLALIFIQLISKPIIHLKEAAEKMAQGKFSSRMPLKPTDYNRPKRFLKKMIGGSSQDELVSLAETFNLMAESLEREDTIRKHLFMNITHELRTPLTIIKTHLEAMADGMIEDIEKSYQIIEEETEKLIHLVKGIEALSLAESSFFQKREVVEINLKEFLAGMVRSMLPVARAKNLSLEINTDPDLFVFTEEEKLETIIRNLLSNAFKFTEKGGVHLRYGTGEKYFFVAIQDTGIGISENQLPLIFDRFYRINKSRSQGLGIGLAIVKELVTLLKGKIEVTSKPGQGTTFTISIPLKPSL